jgi:phage terminase large subunit GpA-like protein
LVADATLPDGEQEAVNSYTDHLRNLAAPPNVFNVWQWAEQNVILSARVTPRPGPYRTDWCPYVREPQEAFTDPKVRLIVLCWASRTSKTETALNCVRYSVGGDAQPCMIVMPSKELARSFSEVRWMPAIEDSPILRAEKPEDSDQYKLLEMHFKRCSVFLTGANSAANLKSRGIGVLMADEIDTWPEESDKETGALQQAMERIKDRPGAKAILTSTPTVESGQIWYEFGLGDQRYYFLPCPECGHMQSLKFGQIRWPEECKDGDGWKLNEVKRLARYHCEKCDAPWNDGQKLAQLKAGAWQPTNPKAEHDRRSYHLSSIYPAWITYGEVAVQFLRAKSNPAELQRVVNSWFAEPFYLGGMRGEFEAAIEARSEETAAEVPQGYKPLMTVDVQQDHVRYVVRAHDEQRNSIRLDYGQLPGFEEAEMVARKYGCSCVGVDMRFRQQQVVTWCFHHAGWIPMLGADGLMTEIRRGRVVVDGGVIKGQEVDCIKHRPAAWKEELYRRIKPPNNAKVPKWGIAGDVGRDYKKEMSGEARVLRKGSRGRQVIEWVKTGPNHYWDCEVYQLALFEVVRPLLFCTVEKPVVQPPSLPSGPFMGELEEIDRARRLAQAGERNDIEITERLWT